MAYPRASYCEVQVWIGERWMLRQYFFDGDEGSAILAAAEIARSRGAANVRAVAMCTDPKTGRGIMRVLDGVEGGTGAAPAVQRRRRAITAPRIPPAGSAQPPRTRALPATVVTSNGLLDRLAERLATGHPTLEWLLSEDAGVDLRPPTRPERGGRLLPALIFAMIVLFALPLGDGRFGDGNGAVQAAALPPAMVPACDGRLVAACRPAPPVVETHGATDEGLHRSPSGSEGIIGTVPAGRTGEPAAPEELALAGRTAQAQAVFGVAPQGAVIPGGATGSDAPPVPVAAASGAAPTAAACTASVPSGPEMLVLDTSTSMGLPIDMPADLEDSLDERMDAADRAASLEYARWLRQPGVKRIDRARDAVRAFVQGAEPGVAVGTVTFGGCGRRNLSVLPPGGDRQTITRTLAALKIRQHVRTPIEAGVRAAARVLGGADGHIVLLTDGIETCGGDPCRAARDIAAAQPGVRIDVVNLGNHPPPACLAELTGGTVHVVPTDAAAGVITAALTATRTQRCR